MCDCQPKDISVAFGPAIGVCCYEVSKDFQDYFPNEVVSREGKYYLDLKRVNKEQLREQGIEEKNIHDSDICTCCNHDYFSYRREGKQTGRMISLMLLR
jgi:hypothetical protein